MQKYKAMYLELFRSQAKAIEILQEAQRTAEDIYMAVDEPQGQAEALSQEDDEEV